jgi:hypothetical protein
LVRFSISALTATTSVLPDIDSAATSGHRPPRVLVPLSQRGARQLDRGDDVIRVAFHQHDIGAFPTRRLAQF